MDSEPLPRTTVAKLVKEALPPSVQATPDFVELVSECASEFIHMVSAEAQEIAQRGKKTTITPDAIVGALEELEFGEFVNEIEVAAVTARGQAKTASAKRSKKLESLGIPHEELLAEQQRLFQKAKSALTPQQPT